MLIGDTPDRDRGLLHSVIDSLQVSYLGYSCWWWSWRTYIASLTAHTASPPSHSKLDSQVSYLFSEVIMTMSHHDVLAIKRARKSGSQNWPKTCWKTSHAPAATNITSRLQLAIAHDPVPVFVHVLRATATNEYVLRNKQQCCYWILDLPSLLLLIKLVRRLRGESFQAPKRLICNACSCRLGWVQ